MAGVQFPAAAKHFSLGYSIKTSSVAHPASYPMGTWCSFPNSNAGAM
jgi:hypothetical protein